MPYTLITEHQEVVADHKGLLPLASYHTSGRCYERGKGTHQPVDSVVNPMNSNSEQHSNNGMDAMGKWDII